MTAVATLSALQDGIGTDILGSKPEEEDVDVIKEGTRIVSPEAYPPPVSPEDLKSLACPADPITRVTIGDREQQRVTHATRRRHKEKDVNPGLRTLTPDEMAALKAGNRVVTSDKAVILKPGLRTLTRDENRALKDEGDCLFDVDLSTVKLTRHQRGLLDRNRRLNSAKRSYMPDEDMTA